MLTFAPSAETNTEDELLQSLNIGNVYTFVYISQRGDMSSRTVLLDNVDHDRELIGGLDYRANDYRSFHIHGVITPPILRSYVLGVADARQLTGCALAFEYYAGSGKVDDRREALITGLDERRMMFVGFDLDKRAYRKFAIEGIIDPHVTATPQ